ncbi:hypothetical protein LXL04_019878 [Taraxacum kok-saghyz]
MSRSQRGSSSQETNQDEGIRVGKDGAKKLTRKYVKVTCSKCKNTGVAILVPGARKTDLLLQFWSLEQNDGFALVCSAHEGLTSLKLIGVKGRDRNHNKTLKEGPFIQRRFALPLETTYVENKVNMIKFQHQSLKLNGTKGKGCSIRKSVEEEAHTKRGASVSTFKSMVKVKDALRNDLRYNSVRHEDRKGIFNEYISELKWFEEEAESISREDAKIKVEKHPQECVANPYLDQSDVKKIFRKHIMVNNQKPFVG